MIDVTAAQPRRKVLSLKLQPAIDPPIADQPPRYVAENDSIYMVWADGGDMPRRVYRGDERSRAESHAKQLAAEHGKRFWVMRAWRGYDPA